MPAPGGPLHPVLAYATHPPCCRSTCSSPAWKGGCPSAAPPLNTGSPVRGWGGAPTDALAGHLSRSRRGSCRREDGFLPACLRWETGTDGGEGETQPETAS